MVNTERFNVIKDYIYSQKENILNDLCDICRIPSINSQSTNENEPFGHNCAVCLNRCADMFENSGLKVTRYEKDGFATARLKGDGSDSIGLICHTDVVPVNPENWKYTSPFEPKIVNGSLVCRGAEDDKSSVIISRYAINAIKHLGYKLNHDVCVFLGSNEENGMDDIRAFVKKCKMPVFSFVVDGEFPLAYGQKGRYLFSATTPEFESITDIFGGSAVNIVIDNVKAKVNIAKMPEKLPKNISVEGSAGNYTVTALGRPAHASEAEKGENALLNLASFLVELPELCQNDKDILKKVILTLSTCDGSAFNINVSAPPFGSLTSSNGMASMENNRLVYTFDIRFPTALEEKEMLNRAENKIKELGFDYKLLDFSHAQISPIGTKPTDIFMDLCKYVSGNGNIKPFVMQGATYAYYLENAYPIGMYIPTAQDFNPGENKGGAHMSDECIPIDSMLQVTAMIAEAILEIDKVL